MSDNVIPINVALLSNSVLVEVFRYLDEISLCRAAQVCRQWREVAYYDVLWKQLAGEKWNINALPPVEGCWRTETKRLLYHVPMFEAVRIEKHLDEVLDVAISHNGAMLSTCSNDSVVCLWSLPDCKEMGYLDMKIRLDWDSSQTVLFNKSDTLLLVCGTQSFAGIKVGVGHVCKIPGMELVYGVELDPYTLSGAWLTDRIFLTGNFSGISSICIQAHQVTDTDISLAHLDPLDAKIVEMLQDTGVTLLKYDGIRHHQMNLLIASVPQPGGNSSKICNPNHSHKCLRNDVKHTPLCLKVVDNGFDKHDSYEIQGPSSGLHYNEVTMDCSRNNMPSAGSHGVNETDKCVGQVLYNRGDLRYLNSAANSNYNPTDASAIRKTCPSDGDGGSLMEDQCIGNSQIYHCYLHLNNQEIDTHCNQCCKCEQNCYDMDIKKVPDEENCDIEVTYRLEPCCKTYIALVSGVHDRICVQELTQEKVSAAFKNGHNENSPTVPHLNKFDYEFQLEECYITGMCISYDQTCIYFNYRCLDKSKADPADDVLDTSERVYCEDLKIGRIDLVTMEMERETGFKGHHGFSNSPLWYICLASSKDFVASGGEDAHAYIWDRHHKALLARLMHEKGVVNGVIFNPHDQETCFTVCDDRLIKVWKSKNRLDTKSKTSGKLLLDN